MTIESGKPIVANLDLDILGVAAVSRLTKGFSELHARKLVHLVLFFKKFLVPCPWFLGLSHLAFFLAWEKTSLSTLYLPHHT